MLFVLQSCGGKTVKDKATLVFINGNITTMEDSKPHAEAVAVRNDTIVALGSNDEIKKYIGDSTKVINLNGKFMMPGFNESHAHFLGLGETKQILDLSQVKNWDEIVSMVAKVAEQSLPGSWIIGRGWHQEKFDPKPNPNVEGYPVHKELSNASPENPVMLIHASGHAIIANMKAMQIAGIDRNTKDPEGGKIEHDSLGNVIGVFEETAEQLIRKYYDDYLAKRTPEQIYIDYTKQIQFASDECLQKGITSFTDAGESFEVINLMKHLANFEKLPVRLNVMVLDSLPALKEKLKDYFIIGYGNNHLTIRAIKQYMDGALGSRGAWLLKPYNDLPQSDGMEVTPLSLLKEISNLAIENGFQVCIHAIGDKANREVLNLYENEFKEHPDKKDLRWRIEHAQLLSKDDIPRFGQMHVIAAMQAIHCTSDASFVPARIGMLRAQEGAFVWRKLINSSAIICNGTDAPVEDVNPVKCFYASVTRKTSGGVEFFPDQKMTRLEALKSYTINGAYASFEENIKGSIKVGKLADLVVLSDDLLKCPENQIQNTTVIYTIVGGKILYKAE
jgi:predicted amidohydrolase YtcJ